VRSQRLRRAGGEGGASGVRSLVCAAMLPRPCRRDQADACMRRKMIGAVMLHALLPISAQRHSSRLQSADPRLPRLLLLPPAAHCLPLD